jgi:probable F420-dependent oxidoreductase
MVERGAHPRTFRFGVEMPRPFDGMSWADSARRLEDLGYSTLLVPDHLHSGFGPITAMATAAAATTTLRVAPMVLACDFRNPAVLAKELASIDVLSNGRLEVGLGAGYNPLDYSRSGIAYDAPGVRVDRLIEHAQVLRMLFGDGPVDFAGEHYRISELDGTPKPYGPGGPPILLAGGGRRLLTFASQHADIIGVNPSLPSKPGAATARDALPDRIDAKFELIRETAGERFGSLEFSAWISVAALGAGAAVAELREAVAGRFGVPADEAVRSPVVLVGDEDTIVEELRQRRDRWGYSYTVLQIEQAETFAPVVARLTGR